MLILDVYPQGPRLFIMVLLDVQFYLFNKKVIKASSLRCMYMGDTWMKGHSSLVHEKFTCGTMGIWGSGAQDRAAGFGFRVQGLVQGLASPFQSL